MKQLLIIFIVLMFQTSPGIKGTWKLIQYRDLTTGQIESKPDNISRTVVLSFHDNDHEGKFKGHTVLNGVGGDYTIENSNIHVTKFGGTKIGEPEWGSKFWKTIYQSSSYSINNDTLTIKYTNNSMAMVFVKTTQEELDH